MTTEALAVVAAKFRASLLAKADEIELAKSALVAGRPTSKLVALMHKLAGAAGFYAENAIAELAADLERRLEAADTDDHVEASERDIDRLIALLRNRGNTQ